MINITPRLNRRLAWPDEGPMNAFAAALFEAELAQSPDAIAAHEAEAERQREGALVQALSQPTRYGLVLDPKRGWIIYESYEAARNAVLRMRNASEVRVYSTTFFVPDDAERLP